MYLIIGANGFLGNYFIKNILKETDKKVLAVDLVIPDTEFNPRVTWRKLDVSNIEEITRLNDDLKTGEPLKIIYLAAYHHPDKVMQNPRLAWRINIIALANFLNLMENVLCLYYPSTEVVYGQGVDGHRFNENDRLNPSNRYGEHKTIAERMVNVYGYNVVRFPVLMGPSMIHGKKHFFDEIVETVRNGGTMEMFEDQKRSMIDFDTASLITLRLAEMPEARQYPIVNISGDEDLSKYELGLRIAHKYGLDESKIIPISMDKDTKIFTAKRSKETLLDNTLVKRILKLNELKFKI